MDAPYSQDLRQRVLGAYDRGKQTKEIAQMFAVNPAWTRRVKQVRREQDRITPLPMGGVRVVKIDLENLRQLVEQQPDATIAELHQRLGGTACCCESAVGMALDRLELTFKKDDPCQRAGSSRCRRASHTVEERPAAAGNKTVDLHR